MTEIKYSISVSLRIIWQIVAYIGNLVKSVISIELIELYNSSW